MIHFIKSTFFLLTCSLFWSSALLAQGTIKIGVAGPHSGAYAAFGEQFWRGANQAAQDINEQDGIAGQRILLVKADDACEPKQAVAVAHRLIDREEVQAVIGHFCSSSTIPASRIYADANVLMITPGSTNPRVTDRGLSTVFRACGRDDQQGAVAADFLYNTLKLTKIAVIHDKDTYGKGIADALTTNLKKMGAEIVLYEGLTRGEKDFNAIVTKIKQTGAEAVYFGGLHTEAGPFVRQLREQGCDIPFVGGDGIVSEDFVISAGGAKMMKNVYMTFGSDPRTAPESKAIVEKFREEGIEPEGYTLYSYAALQIIRQAIEATQSTDGEKLSEWLKNNTVKTILGPKSWDGKGDLKTTDYVMYYWDRSGKYYEYKDNNNHGLDGIGTTAD